MIKVMWLGKGTLMFERILLINFLSLMILPSESYSQIRYEERDLFPTDSTVGERYGWAVAVDDGLAVVGAWEDDTLGVDAGSAYTFNINTGTQLRKLLATDGAANDQFGRAVAIENGLVAITAELDDDHGNVSGSVYMFDAVTGTQLSKIYPSDAGVGDHFGSSIAMQNGIIAVGATDNNDFGEDSGAAYLFNAATGAQLHKLLPSDGRAGDEFGRSIAIANDFVIVGTGGAANTSGAAYVFNVQSGRQVAKLRPVNGMAGDRFGWCVAISGTIAAVTAEYDSTNGNVAGAAYMFDAITGTQLTKLFPTDAFIGDHFGASIAFRDGIIAIGATDTNEYGDDSGSAYAFLASSGEQLYKLLPSSGMATDEFGKSIAISDGKVLVGRGDEAATSIGNAFLFDVTCLADVNRDYILSPTDFTAWIAAFNTQAPECDQNGDGSCTPADFTAWISNYNAGCK